MMVLGSALRCGLHYPETPKEDPNPGKEIAAVLVDNLKLSEIAIIKIEDIQYAHEIVCSVGKRKYSLIVSYDWNEVGWWEIFYTASLNWLQKLMGDQEETEMRSLTKALSHSVGNINGISEMRWYASYPDSGSLKYTNYAVF